MFNFDRNLIIHYLIQNSINKIYHYIILRIQSLHNVIMITYLNFMYVYFYVINMFIQYYFINQLTLINGMYFNYFM